MKMRASASHAHVVVGKSMAGCMAGRRALPIREREKRDESEGQYVARRSR